MAVPIKAYVQDSDRRRMAGIYALNARGLLALTPVDACDGDYGLAVERLPEEVTRPLVEIAYKAAQTLAKVNGAPDPGAVRAAAENIISYGFIPLIATVTPDFVQRGGDMAQAAFTILKVNAQPLNSAAMTKLRQSVKLEGERLASDVEYWNTCHRVVAGIASMGLTEATDVLDKKLNQMVNLLGKVNTDYRNAKAAAGRGDAKAQDFVAKYEGNMLISAGNTIARGVGVSDKDLGLAGFGGMGDLGQIPPPPMVFSAPARYLGAGLATRVGSVVISLLQKIPGPWSKLATGGVAATVIGAIVLVGAIIAALEMFGAYLKSFLPPWMGGSSKSNLGSPLFMFVLLAGGGYYAYKKGYLAKIGLKPKGA